MGVGESDTIAIEMVSVGVDPVTRRIESGRDIRVFFDIENEGNTTVEDVDFSITDHPNFVVANTEKSLGNLDPDAIESWDWVFEADEGVRSPRNSDIRHRLSYDSTAYTEHSFVAVSEEEYMERLEEGMGDIVDHRYNKKETPVDIVISFSETQPVVEEDEFLFEFKFEDAGDGFPQGMKLDKGAVEIEYPDFISPVGDCHGRMSMGQTVELVEDLYFHGDSTSWTSCRFEVDSIDRLDEGVFTITADYTYVKDDYFTLVVEP